MSTSQSLQSLPNLRQKPGFENMLQTLEFLEPRNCSQNRGSPVEDAKKVFSFLMSITTSPLEWLDRDASVELAQDRRDVLYDLAAKRIAERCGRNAISEMNRKFVVPPSKYTQELSIDLREPGIVEDNLGLKTWGTAHAIALKLGELRETFFAHLLDSKDSMHEITATSGLTYRRVKTRALELGAGTGLLGLVVSKIWQCTVIATDLPQIQENLLFNVRQNQATPDQAGGSVETHGHVRCETLDWKNTNEALADFASKTFEIVVAADPIYDDDHPQLVASMIKKYLAHTRDSRALVALPIRDLYSQRKAESFRSYMSEYGFTFVHEGEDEFRDPDWKDTDGSEVDPVICWYGIWRVALRRATSGSGVLG